MNFTIKTPSYLPNVGYFKDLIDCDLFLFADHFQYTKRSVITRSSLLKNGNLLSVPVLHTGHKQSISEKKIVYSETWVKTHLKTLQHTYHSLPYFEEYYSKIESIYLAMENSLAKFLYVYTQFFLKELKIECTIYFTSSLNIFTDLNDTLIKFSKDYNADFLFTIEDHKAGWIDINRINNSKIHTIALEDVENELLNMNILEFLFENGAEAPFRLREI